MLKIEGILTDLGVVETEVHPMSWYLSLLYPNPESFTVSQFEQFWSVLDRERKIDYILERLDSYSKGYYPLRHAIECVSEIAVDSSPILARVLRQPVLVAREEIEDCGSPAVFVSRDGSLEDVEWQDLVGWCGLR